MSVENNTNETIQLSEEVKTPEQVEEKQKEDALDMLSMEVREYLRINGIGDIASMPIEMLRAMNNQTGAGRGGDIELAGLQENIGINQTEKDSPNPSASMDRMVQDARVTETIKGAPVTSLAKADTGTLPPPDGLPTQDPAIGKSGFSMEA